VDLYFVELLLGNASPSGNNFATTLYTAMPKAVNAHVPDPSIEMDISVARAISR
jgi:hypothetical protein